MNCKAVEFSRDKLDQIHQEKSRQAAKKHQEKGERKFG